MINIHQTKKFNSIQGLFAIHPFFRFISFAKDNGQQVLDYYRSLTFEEKEDYQYTAEHQTCLLYTSDAADE